MVAEDLEEFKEEVEPMVPNDAPETSPRPPKRKMSGKYIKEHVELHKTGKWGKIGKREMIAVAAALLLITGGVVAAVLGLVVFREEGTPETLPPRPDPPTPAPSEFPENDPTEQLNAILADIRKTTLLADNTTALLQSTLDALPTEASFYTAFPLSSDPSQPAVVRAMSWILNTDPRDVAPDSVWLVPRFALATLYYATNGEEWTNNEGWLTADRICEWHGVFCNRFDSAVQEIDLNTNNLEGPIPPELALISSMYGIVLTQNKLTGAPPFKALGNMPVLSFLFLNNNQLTGEISPAVRDNGVLTTLMVQRNEFTGSWPRSFCDRLDHLLQEFGADCDEVDLSRCVCCPVGYERNNCF